MTTAAEKPVRRFGDTPSVGRIVHYYDREEIVNADQQKRDPEPFAARITRVHRDQDGEVLDVVNLAVDDPEIGQQIRRDVQRGDDLSKPEAHRWYWPPYMPGRGASLTNRLTMDPPAGQNAAGPVERATNEGSIGTGPQTDAPAPAAAATDGGGTGTENAPAQ